MNLNIIYNKLLHPALLHNYPTITATLLSRNYAFKSDLKIKWIRPEKIDGYKLQKSGDLYPMPAIPQSRYTKEFSTSKELETASETVQKLFSLQFSPRWKSTQIYVDETLNKVQRHHQDRNSTEARVARWTAAIRSLQQVMENFPRNRRLKVKLQELIDRRNKHLKYVRRWDYKRFEWLLERLELTYRPHPIEYYQVSRKDSLRKLTDEYCDKIKEERLQEYKEELREEQPKFLEEKIRTLEFVREQQLECGVEPTVQVKDIESVRKQLLEINKTNVLNK